MPLYSGAPLIRTQLGQKKVSLFQGLKSTQTWNLGRKKVSCLERCPYFRGVLIEGFHCRSVIQYIEVSFIQSIPHQGFHCSSRVSPLLKCHVPPL